MYPYLHIFGFSIPMYGIMTMTGLAAGLILLIFTCKKYKIPRSDAMYFACYAMIGAFIGAKLLYIIVELPRIIADPSFLLSVITGGMVFYGGVIGGLIGGYIYARHYKFKIIRFMDVAAPCLALGQAFGRIGCFCAGCCYGMPYDGPLCVVYPPGGIAPPGVPLLPAPLMESAFLILLTAALCLILRKSKKEGGTAGWYFVLYAVWRFTIEFFRSDPRGSVGGLSTSQFISIFLFALGLFFIIRKPKASVSPDSGPDRGDGESGTGINEGDGPVETGGAPLESGNESGSGEEGDKKL